ncbi:MAG TPA: hypothetical protein VF155_13000 [Candidatus Dormibacteraeota bacterium]
MNLLVYKLTLTPLAIGLATAVGRRFGPALGAWLAGIPFTSAPVAIFVTLDHGITFGQVAAAAILAGTASQAGFALVYSAVARRLRWPVALTLGLAAFAVLTVLLDELQPPPVPALEIVVGAIALSLALMPRVRGAPRPEAPPLSVPVDIAIRAVIATAFVVVLTALSTQLGPTLAGLVSPLPIFGAVLIVFPHRMQGTDAAVSACRGFLWGLFAATAFGFTLSELLPTAGLAVAMAAALGAALAVQGASLLVVRSPPTRG